MGEADKALEVWQQGAVDEPDLHQLDGTLLQNAHKNLWLLIAKIASRQGRDGSGVTYKNNSVSYRKGYLFISFYLCDRKFETDEEEKQWKRDKLLLALKANKNASILAPDEHNIQVAIALLHAQLGEHDQAEKVWEYLISTVGTEAQFLIGYAKCLKNLGKQEQMVNTLEQVLKEDPRNGESYKLLSENYERIGDITKAEECKRKEKFFKWLPSACTLEYTEENYQTFQKITDKERDKRVDTIEHLMHDKNNRSTQFILAICASHAECGTVENQCFQELDNRIDQDFNVQVLLRHLLREFSSTCTVKNASQILAKRKDQTILANLIRLLPKDMNLFSMGIPEALDTLGDDVAVEYLVDAVGIDFEKDDNDDGDIFGMGGLGHDLLRVRCCLALGAFGSDKMVQYVLNQALHNNTLSNAAHAALYRITNDEKYLAPLEEKAQHGEYIDHYIKAYLESMFIDNQRVAAIVRTLQEKEKEERGV
jgi:tetratricopeptide (TPR) repeat protein